MNKSLNEMTVEELDLSELEYKLDEIKSLINKKKSEKYPLKSLHDLYSKVYGVSYDFDVEVSVGVRGVFFTDNRHITSPTDISNVDVLSADAHIIYDAYGGLWDHPEVKKIKDEVEKNRKLLDKEVSKMAKKLDMSEQEAWDLLEKEVYNE